MTWLPEELQEIHDFGLLTNIWLCSEGVGISLYSSDTCNMKKFILTFNWVFANFNWSLIPSPWSVFNSELIFFLMWVTVTLRVMNSKTNASSSVNLSNGTKLYLGGVIGDETRITLVLNLLILHLVDGNSSGLPIFVYIFYLLHSLPNVPISTFFSRNHLDVTP